MEFFMITAKCFIYIKNLNCGDICNEDIVTTSNDYSKESIQLIAKKIKDHIITNFENLNICYDGLDSLKFSLGTNSYIKYSIEITDLPKDSYLDEHDLTLLCWDFFKLL